MQIPVINAEGGRYYEALIDVLSKYVFEFVDGSALNSTGYLCLSQLPY